MALFNLKAILCDTFNEGMSAIENNYIIIAFGAGRGMIGDQGRIN